ncbi:MAG: signal peptidase II [Bacillota bacterium]
MLETIIIFLLLLVDQASKIAAERLLTQLPGNTFPVWEGVFHFTFAKNRGASFGILQGQHWLLIPITLIAICAIVFVLIRFHKRLHPLLRFSLALIVAGAIGNLIDRAFLGYVRDMLDFRLINFAVFNAADSAVSVGAVLLGIDVLFCKKGRKLMAEWEEHGGKKKKRVPPAETAEHHPNGEDAP